MYWRFIYRNDDIWPSRVWGPGPAGEEAHYERPRDEDPHQPPRHAHRQGAAGHVSRVTCSCNVLLQDVTAVFRSLETGLREATMDPKVFS